MEVVGRVESVWRYAVKSMRGEELPEAFVGFAGVYGDRIYGFRNSAAAKGFPYFTGRQRPEMVLYRPRFRNPALAAAPPNIAETEKMGPGVTPLYPTLDNLMVDVLAPTGQEFAIDDPALIAHLTAPVVNKGVVDLMRSERAMTDCRPVSILSVQTVRKLGEEVGIAMDKRRFRASIYADLGSAAGFAEDGFVGRTVRIGERALIAIVGQDSRCKMITLDPDTAEATPDILRTVTHGHGGMVGVYCSVITEGMIRSGDAIALLGRDEPLTP